MVFDQTMSDFDQKIIQDRAFKQILDIAQSQKIPNALLFLGDQGTQRKKAALLFTKLLNCLEEIPSNTCTCRSCRKIDANSHPDIIQIDLINTKKSITIDQIREISIAISGKPNEARYRLVLISEADLMNVQAQNALLKMLEEPPEKTFFILMAQKIYLLLPTIISRCRKIRFKPLSEKFIEEYLTNEHGISLDSARIAARTAGSELNTAMVLLNLDTDSIKVDWIARRRWLLEMLAQLIKINTNNLSSCFILAQRLSLDPDLINKTITVMITFFRDLTIYRFDPEKIVNLDFSDTFADISQTVAPSFFFQCLKELYNVEKKLSANSALRLTLEDFFLKLICSKGKLIYD